MATQRKLGLAFSQETGLAHFVEVFAADRLAVDATTLCRMLGYEYSSATMTALRKNGLPEPKAPAGSDRWDLDEIRAWWAKCRRSPEKRNWSEKRRNDHEAKRQELEAAGSTH